MSFITSDGTNYLTNYLFRIDWGNLVKVVPFLGYTDEGYCDCGDESVGGYRFHHGPGPGHYIYLKEGLEKKYKDYI